MMLPVRATVSCRKLSSASLRASLECSQACYPPLPTPPGRPSRMAIPKLRLVRRVDLPLRRAALEPIRCRRAHTEMALRRRLDRSQPA